MANTSNLSSGVEALLSRMQTHPAEFYNDAPKWHFIFKEKFREVLTEPEKGAIHEALKEVRRKEFDDHVMRTLLVVEDNDEQEREEAMRLDSYGNLGIGAKIPNKFALTGAATTSRPLIQVGKETLSENDIARMKEVTMSPSRFK